MADAEWDGQAYPAGSAIGCAAGLITVTELLLW
jgi:hypothetical protein